MRKATLALVGFGLFALAACDRGNQDQLNANDLNGSESLDELSNDAANLAANAQELENKSEALEPTDNAAGAETPADENIAGM